MIIIENARAIPEDCDYWEIFYITCVQLLMSCKIESAGSF